MNKEINWDRISVLAAEMRDIKERPVNISDETLEIIEPTIIKVILEYLGVDDGQKKKN